MSKQIKLSENFTLEEMCYSEIAINNGVLNEVQGDSYVIANLSLLCNRVLQPLRDEYNAPININSGFRSFELNKLIGGSPTSDHCYGMAADINIKGLNDDAFLLIKNTLPFKQLIWEKGDDNYPEWIHVSFSLDNNKREVLKYDGKRYIELEG